jgi:UDP-glucose 4-epimerase
MSSDHSTWLLTGGAGYIGAHIARAFVASGRSVIVLDDLSTGHADRVPDDVPLVEASCNDGASVRDALEQHSVTGVVHLAAKKAAGESVERPLWYYRQNLDSTLTVLECMAATGVDQIVFSSSAATFGTPEGEEVTEESPTLPESPYGETKLVSEWVIADLARASDLQYVNLRYFNVAGAGAPDLGDTGVFNLIPLVFRALSTGARPQVFGGDYDTRDGSCIRDYIHVADLADAHVAAAERLETGPAREVYNVGRGEGVTVKEVMAAVHDVTGIDFEYEVVGPRAGDPARVVAVVDKIRDDLGWRARHDLHDMVRSAWEAWDERPGR